MKGLKLKSCSFLFTTPDLSEYEVRVEKRSDSLKDFNIFKNGDYEVSYPTSYDANQSNAKDILTDYLTK